MARGRPVPSLLTRTTNLVSITYPEVPGVPKIRVSGSARLNDAFGPVAGVGGAGATPMFEVASGGSYISPSIRGTRRGILDENVRGRTRAVFNPDDFSTPVVAAGAGNYIPTDDQTLFLRIQHYNTGRADWDAPGPILVVPPYDFMTTTAPVFTVTGIAPNMALSGTFPPNLPDFLGEGVMSFMVPGFSCTFSMTNLEADGGIPLFFSCAPGMPPSVVKGDREVSLTGAGIPDVYVGAPNGNPWFTLRIAITNQG